MRTLSLLPLAAAAVAGVKPHIMFVMIDDWGYHNVGLKDSSVLTPHFDEFAKEGVHLDRHYTYKYCSPTRTSFLSGRLPMHIKQDNLEQGGIPLNMKTVADGLKAAGYKTYHLGKWHAGFATWRHIPHARGFDGSLGYFHACQDSWNQHDEQATGFFVDLFDTDKPGYGLNGTYSTYLWDTRIRSVIAAHDASVPLFVYYAFKNNHAPLEAPQRFLDLYKSQCDASVIAKDCKVPSPVCPVQCLRQRYLAETSAWDEAFGNFTGALKAKGMWDETLVVVSADNGGPIYNTPTLPALQGGATNYPLRGGKMSNWEGGVRVNAWAGGGFIPAARRGATVTSLIHICDWYVTFLGLAGADVPPAGEGMPALDSIDQWGVVSGASTAARTEIPLDAKVGAARAGKGDTGGVVFIQQQDDKLYKFIVGTEYQDIHTEASYPNVTSPKFGPECLGKVSVDGPCGPHTDCADGCLFDVAADPEERQDLAKLPELADVLSKMKARSIELNATYWQHDTKTWDDAAGMLKSRAQAAKNGGFWGPFEQ